MNLPQQGANNNAARTDAPFQENPNVVAPESNFFSSSPFAETLPNPSENLDLNLNFGMSDQGATVSPVMVSSSNVAFGVHGIKSNPANISRKRSVPGNASRHVEEPKRLDSGSQVRAPHNVTPHNAGTTIPPTNPRAEWMDNTNHRRASRAQPFVPTHPLHSPLQHSHTLQPLPFQVASFMPGPAFNVNTMTPVNATHLISPFPDTGVNIMFPLFEHRNNIFGPVLTSMGFFPTYRPNWPYVDTSGDTAGRAFALVLPHQFQPPESEPMQLLPGIGGNGGRVSNARANTYNPLSDYASSSPWIPPPGSLGMHHPAAANSSGYWNHHSIMQIPSPAIPPNVIPQPGFPLPQFPPDEARRRLPNEVCVRPMILPPYNYKNLVFFLLALNFRLNFYTLTCIIVVLDEVVVKYWKSLLFG